MLLSNETKDKLVNLAPDVLFHGTRFLVPIFIHDEIALSLTTEAVHLTSCPEEAATYAAAGPRPFDDGRGAIIALDRSLLPDTYKGEGKNDFMREYGIHPLSHCAVGVFWLDELAPGAGLLPRLTPPGPLKLPAQPYQELYRRFWATIEDVEGYRARGVRENIETLFEIYMASMYGEKGPNGLERDAANSHYAAVLPGVHQDPATAAPMPPFVW